MSSTRSTTQSMVVVCERPRAKPSTDIATIMGGRSPLIETMSRQVAATTVAITVSFERRDPPDEQRGRCPCQQGAAGADAQQDPHLGRGQADGDAEQRHVDQEQVDAALGEKLVISAAGIPVGGGVARPARPGPCGRSTPGSGAHRQGGGGQSADEDPGRDQQGRRGRLEAGLVAVADDHPAQYRADDLAQRRDSGERAEPADARERAVGLRHDALRADGARHVPDAQRGRTDRNGGDVLGNTRTNAASAAMARPPASGIAGWCRSVHRPKPTASSIGGSEARGRQAEGEAVGTEGQESVGRHRPGQGDRDLQQEDAGDGADEPRRRETFGNANRSELPATLRRGDVYLDTVGVAELEEPGRVGCLRAVDLDAAFLQRGHHGAGVLDGHPDVVGPHRP